VTGNVTRPESLPPALEGVTHILHLAGYVNGGRGPAQTFMTVNAQGTANLARSASEAGVEHLIYTSSITVYGLVQDANEEAPLAFTPGYPASKIRAENVLRQWLPEQATILRLPLVLGAGDSGFMCPALRGLRQAGRVILIGSGAAPWSVLAAADAARALASMPGPATDAGPHLQCPGRKHHQWPASACYGDRGRLHTGTTPSLPGSLGDCGPD
jgi:nucleoside-diphosphate-sugar epimerase